MSFARTRAGVRSRVFVRSRAGVRVREQARAWAVPRHVCVWQDPDPPPPVVWAINFAARSLTKKQSSGAKPAAPPFIAVCDRVCVRRVGARHASVCVRVFEGLELHVCMWACTFMRACVRVLACVYACARAWVSVRLSIRPSVRACARACARVHGVRCAAARCPPLRCVLPCSGLHLVTGGGGSAHG